MRKEISRTFSNYSTRIDESSDEASVQSSLRTPGFRRSNSGPPRYQRSNSSVEGSSTQNVAERNMEQLMTDESDKRRHSFHTPTIDRSKFRRGSIIQSRRTSALGSKRRARLSDGLPSHDDSIRSLGSRRSLSSDRSSMLAKDEEWAMFKEALGPFA